MNILDLEIKYSELQEFLSGHYSQRAKLFKISDFIFQVFQLQTPNTAEAYLSELLPQLLDYISSLELRGNNPKDLNILLDQLEQIKKYKFAEISLALIEHNISSIKSQINLLNDWLNGINTSKKARAIYFPLLEKTESGYSNGFLESIEVEIKPGENSFYITPSESESDKGLERQVKISWQIALNICKRYTHKIKSSHTVFIHFINKYGIYSGSSLGVALTLGFVEALLKYYNTSITINTNSNIAFTGEIDEAGIIKTSDDNIIKEKVKTVFYSDIEIFVIPASSFQIAKVELNSQKKNYPKRNLGLIGIESVDDLLNRRNIVDIRKQKIVIRTGKFVKRNWASALSIILLTIFFTYLFAFDFDENPVSYNSDGSKIYFKNKNGKVLWSVNFISLFNESENPNYLKNKILILDTNNDGINEILMIGNDHKFLNCYSSDHKLIWQYRFDDQVFSQREIMDQEYGMNIIDTCTVFGEKSVYLSSSNFDSFASAIYRISPVSGKRLKGTFWASGHIMACNIINSVSNPLKLIEGVGYDNGYEDLVYFVCRLDTITKVRLSTSEYLIKNFPLADMKYYIRIRKTDYDNYYEQRTPLYLQGSFDHQILDTTTSFATALHNQNAILEVGYKLTGNSNNIKIVIGSDFRIQRDTLVKHGILKEPYTDTEEYKEIIKNNILYWLNGKWVKRNELD